MIMRSVIICFCLSSYLSTLEIASFLTFLLDNLDHSQGRPRQAPWITLPSPRAAGLVFFINDQWHWIRVAQGTIETHTQYSLGISAVLQPPLVCSLSLPGEMFASYIAMLALQNKSVEQEQKLGTMEHGAQHFSPRNVQIVQLPSLKPSLISEDYGISWHPRRIRRKKTDLCNWVPYFSVGGDAIPISLVGW